MKTGDEPGELRLDLARLSGEKVAQRVAPLASAGRDIRATLFVGVYGFF